MRRCLGVLALIWVSSECSPNRVPRQAIRPPLGCKLLTGIGPRFPPATSLDSRGILPPSRRFAIGYFAHHSYGQLTPMLSPPSTTYRRCCSNRFSTLWLCQHASAPG